MRWFSLATALVATLAVSAAEAKGIEPTRISLPKGPGSIEGLGRNFTPSLASGTASYGVDITVPPGAGGLVPRLSLDYDSGGGVSDLGLGWRLGGLPSIRRRTEEGLPRFDTTDALEITGLGTPSDLLEVSPGTFRPQYESGAFVRVQRSGDGWEARDKSGTTYRFGGAGYVVAEDGRIATWLLREQLDLHGHRIAYEWSVRDGHAALARAVWNDFSPEVRNEVLLAYEDRPDRHELFSSGIREVLSTRIRAIEVKHGGALVRRYDLAYAPGVHSRLASVTLVGRDGVSKLPSLTLAYTEPSFAADGQIITMTKPPGRSPEDKNVELTDLDGDGLPDLLVSRAGAYRSYVNHDGRSWKAGVDWSATDSPSVELGTTGVQLADVDGDGAIDLLVKSGTDSLRYLRGDSATSFRSAIAIPTVPNVTFEDPDVKLADMDGDRRVDVVVTTAAGLAIGYNVRGIDWTVPTMVGVVDPRQPLRFSDGHTQLCDVNGDRLQDLCYLRSGALTYWLGRGRGRFEPPRAASGVPAYDDASPWQLHDLNGDGWVDLVHVGVNQVEMVLAHGTGQFDAPRVITGTPYKGPNVAVRFADMNASGTVDIVWIDVTGTPDKAWQYLELFPQGRGGLLRKIDNGLGRVSTIDYTPAAGDAAAARDAGKAWSTRMNVAMPVVRKTSVDSSLGDPLMVTEYQYRDGTWSPRERTFAGFGGGTERDRGDEHTPTLITENTYDVGLSDRTLRGSLLTSEARDERGYRFSHTIDRYLIKTLERATDGRAVEYGYKVAEEVIHIEGTDESRARRTLVEFEQNEFGDVVAERRWGEIAGDDKLLGSDETIVLRTYANNVHNWLLGRLATEEVLSAGGQRVRMRKQYYDGAPFEGLPLGQVTRGNVSRAEEWVEGERFDLDSATAYDKDGNAVETRNARGGGRRFEWDPADRTSLLAEAVKLQGDPLVEHASWDRAFGNVVRVVGYDGQTTTYGYDPFGRVTTVVMAGDTAERPTLAYAYDERAPLSRVSTTRRVWRGRDDIEYSEALVDGLGRARGSLIGSGPARWVLGGVTLLDARGEARKALRDRFVGDGEHDAPPLRTDAVGTDTDRDALARPIRSRSPLGHESKTAYDPLGVRTWDAEQAAPDGPYEHAPATTRRDGQNRVVATTYVLGGRTLSATFTWNAAGDLLSKRDPEGNVSQYGYDGSGRRTSVVDADTGKHAFIFDANDDLIEHHKPDGSVLRFTYDLAGRELTADWNGDGIPEVAHSWDRSDGQPQNLSYRGKLVRRTEPSGATAFAYDERQRLTMTKYEVGAASYETHTAYDDQDREYWRSYPDGSSIRIHRDARGGIAAYGKAVEVAHDADGTELRRVFNTGVVQEYGYDNDRRRTDSRVRGVDGTIIQHLRWKYDRAGNVLAVGDLRANVASDRDRSEEYTYDNLYRLVHARGTWGTAEWTYSPSGNVLRRTSSEPALDAGSLEYGAGAGPHALTRFKDRTIRYDAAGRMLDDGDRTYTWNAADQLIRATARSGASVENAFDGAGARRVRVERRADGATHTTVFLDDWSEVQDGKLSRFIVHGGHRIAKLAESNGAPGADPLGGGCSTSGLGDGASAYAIPFALIVALVLRFRARFRTLGWLASGVLVFALLGCAPEGGEGPPPILEGTVQVLSENDELLFDDGVGSLTEHTDGAGRAKSTSAAYPFGVTRFDTSPTTRKYANTPRDKGIGLDCMGARFYAADLGVWTSADPIAIDDPTKSIEHAFAAANAYGYAAANPIRFTDREGRFFEAVVGGGVAIVGSVFVAAAAVVTYHTNPAVKREVDTTFAKIEKAVTPTPGAPSTMDQLAFKAGVAYADATAPALVPSAPVAPPLDMAKGGKAKAHPNDKIIEPRPKFRSGTIRKAWSDAADGPKKGTKLCPTCGKIITGKKVNGKRDFDVDHTRKTWNQRKPAMRRDRHLTRDKVNDNYQRDVRIQCPSCNRGHRFEPK